MRIYFSKDLLLNSKNEYLQNCITRVVVQEEKWETRLRESKEEEEERESEARLNAFKEWKQSVQLEENPTPQLIASNDGGIMTGDAQDSSEVLSPQKGKLMRDCILLTPKRKATWQTLSNTSKKRKLEIRKRKPTILLADMNISGWWRRVENMESNPIPKGRRKSKGQSDYKLAYFSLWWKRMERDEFTNKQDRRLGARLKTFLLAGKKTEEKPVEVNQDHHKIDLHGPTPRNVVQSFENLPTQNLKVDSRTPPNQHGSNIMSDMIKEHPPTSARPISKVIEFFEDLSTNSNTGIKRQLHGKLESPAKYARTLGSYGEGLFRNYVGDFQQAGVHESSEGEGVIEDTHAQNQTDRDTNDESSLRSPLSPPPGPPL